MLLVMLVLMLLAHRVTIFFWGRLANWLNCFLKTNRLLRGRCDEPSRQRLLVDSFVTTQPTERSVVLRPLGSFPRWGLGWGPPRLQNLAGVNPAVGVFHSFPGKADRWRSTTASPHPGLPPKGEGGRTGLSSYILSSVLCLYPPNNVRKKLSKT